MTIEQRTLRLLLRDNLKHDCHSRDCCTSRTLKSYEAKVRRGMKDDAWKIAAEATNEWSRILLHDSSGQRTRGLMMCVCKHGMDRHYLDYAGVGACGGVVTRCLEPDCDCKRFERLTEWTLWVVPTIYHRNWQQIV